ncbi:MAG: ParB/RepB/Spo0J family partition protein [Anaerolineae bacterium]|nr:ParB/RepB/Spo0J family partition protein [Anaerolineae bacterium]
MTKKGGLGRGLGAIIPGESRVPTGDLIYIPIDQILPNPRQPRLDMDDKSLMELAESIREHGVLQPLIVTGEPGASNYTLIAGERRLRASRLAGLDQVPAILRPAGDQERLELALIENIQRADLSPLEAAEAYQILMDEFGLRHEDVAARVGKSRSTITNTTRLLDLPDEVKTALRKGLISEGHARALLSLKSAEAQISVLNLIIDQGFSVRQTEAIVNARLGTRPERTKPREVQPEVQALEDRLLGYLGTKVRLNRSQRGSGSVVIYYFSDEELNDLMQKIIKDE